jgi:hypothetical protein
MKAEGFSIREIARELGLSRIRVHRVLSASPPTDCTAISGDPILSLLTDADLAHLGLSAADVAAGEL